MTVSSSQPKVVVTSSLNFWRAHENAEIKAVAEDLIASRQEAGDELVISGAFFQEPKKAKMGRLLGTAGRIATPLLAAGALLAVGIASVPVGIIAGAFALTSALLAGASKSHLQQTLADYQQAKKADAPEGLDLWRDGGPELALPSETPQEGLRDLLTANMRDFPTSLHIVHANGHGVGAKYSAGLAGEAFAASLNQAAQKSGRPADVLLLESCLGANFEQLARFENSVKYVVGFEDAIPTSAAQSGRIPLQEMITETTDESSARDVALEMAQISGRHFDQPGDDAIASVPLADRLKPKHLDKIKFGTDSTAVAIDMKAFQQKLHPAMNSLGLELSSLLKSQPDFRSQIAAARETAKITEDEDLIDLGLFLNHLSPAIPEGSSVQKALQNTLKGLDDTLIAKRTGDKFPLSGLSIHTASRARNSSGISQSASAPYGEHLPPGWLKFAQDAF